MTTPRSLLVLGGARSGKSRHAQAHAETLAGPLVYIATAQAGDAEMADRIARHRADRGPRWTTVEAPVHLPDAMLAWHGRGAVLLVDCLTLWTSNLMLGGHDVEQAGRALTDAIGSFDGHVVLVANEVGLGIVPDNALARQFRDRAGTLNQSVAACVEQVVFLAAGLPLRLK
jgi:adenosylcobinamide kinase/adenosylcobinamide-phosphate guanylyltransferase